MNKIGFLHWYQKMPEKKEVILLTVQKRDIENIPKEFLNYDTLYSATVNGELTEKHSKLQKKGDVLILFFFSREIINRIFTTIRRWTPEKEKYYKSKIGEEFEIVVEEEGK